MTKTFCMQGIYWPCNDEVAYSRPRVAASERSFPSRHCLVLAGKRRMFVLIAVIQHEGPITRSKPAPAPLPSLATVGLWASE
jgi:hypothetical protein